jgi:steroid delta-isomerase-like uncharacterized protein
VTNEQIVRDACRIIWTEHDLSRIPEFYAEDFKADYTFTDWGVGLEGIKALATQQREAFPDYSEHIDELIDGGDRIVVVLTIRGTHLGALPNLPATGKAFEIRDVTICRIENGKIAAQSGLSDHLSFFLQAGLIELPGAAQ